ncbi:hypothetical protein CCH79_00009782 [Gambusia affinis]|uniref:Uncharacterized protein n=1 Tax=Gambusia affinis TaxID=33528 RepID=A0A315V561_GAMAF|nr:hypothetical protein CCH79_00009782 [Gambusia affinis]
MLNELKGTEDLFPAPSVAPPCRMEQHIRAYYSIHEYPSSIFNAVSTEGAGEREREHNEETEISTRRKECEALEAEVKKKNQTCQTLPACLSSPIVSLLSSGEATRGTNCPHMVSRTDRLVSTDCNTALKPSCTWHGEQRHKHRQVQ